MAAAAGSCVVALADDVNSRHAFEDRLRRQLIVIFCFWCSTGGQDSRVERAANQQRKALLLGEWQEIVETVLLKQCVSAGEQEAIERWLRWRSERRARPR